MPFTDGFFSLIPSPDPVTLSALTDGFIFSEPVKEEEITEKISETLLCFEKSQIFQLSYSWVNDEVAVSELVTRSICVLRCCIASVLQRCWVNGTSGFIQCQYLSS